MRGFGRHSASIQDDKELMAKHQGTRTNTLSKWRMSDYSRRTRFVEGVTFQVPWLEKWAADLLEGR